MRDSGPKSSLTATLVALVAALLVCVLIIVFISEKPADALYSFFAGPFLNVYHFGNMIDDAGLLILTGLGITLAFKAGVFNLGGEGQAYTGAIVAAQLALLLKGVPAVIGIPLIVLGSAAAAAVFGGISGVLRWKWNLDELITTFLLSSAAMPIIDYLIAEPLRDDAGYLLATSVIPERLRFAHLLPPSHLNGGLFIGLVLAGALWLLFYRTRWGYELRQCGLNRTFAQYGNIPVGVYIVVPMTASGALHGIAGAMQVTGTRFMAVQGATAGLGWNGIAVALIAEQNPLAVVPAALIFSYLNAATETAMLRTDFSFELSFIIQAIVFLLITAKVVRMKTGGRRR